MNEVNPPKHEVLPEGVNAAPDVVYAELARQQLEIGEKIATFEEEQGALDAWFNNAAQQPGSLDFDQAMARRAQEDKEPLRQSIIANPHLRLLYATAVDIADIRYDKSIPELKRQLLVKEREDKLENLLLKYSEPQNVQSNNKKALEFREKHGDPPVLTSEILDFIIDATVEKRAKVKTKKSLKAIGKSALTTGTKTESEDVTSGKEKSERKVTKKTKKPADVHETNPPALVASTSEAKQATTQGELAIPYGVDEHFDSLPKDVLGVTPKTPEHAPETTPEPISEVVPEDVDGYADYAFREIFGNSYTPTPDTTPDPIVETSEPAPTAGLETTPEPILDTTSELAPGKAPAVQWLSPGDPRLVYDGFFGGPLPVLGVEIEERAIMTSPAEIE